MSAPISAELQSLINVQEDPFVLIDERYRIVAANRAYCVNYGLEPDKVVGRRCHEVSHLSDVPCHQNGEDCPHQAVFSTGKIHEVMHTHFDRHNRPEYVRIKGHPIAGPDNKRYLGEVISRIVSSDELDCKEMQMIGKSPAFLACLDHLTRAAESEASVLLLGESGVGKELAAQYLHKRSSRRARAFITVNCASIAENMFEDELFGHERGAFTGCVGRKQGLFELADGGILFLDEIGEIPLTMQAKFLRVLESGEFRRLGGTGVLHADVRLIFATNRNLLEMAQAGQFRLDLYYRISGFDLRLPTLRERRNDIPALAEALLKRITRTGIPQCRLTDDAMEKLLGYAFPGNVRELRNILMKAIAMCNNGIISAEHIHLGNQPIEHPHIHPVAEAERETGMGTAMSEIEAQHIAALLTRHNGHRRNVADLLGISERTLYRKLKRYSLV
jgi:two-component system response regulator AtoC